LIFPISLGIIAAGGAFLYHALVAHHPPGTPVVNPVFSLLMILAGGAGLYAGGAAVYRRILPAPPGTPPAAPPPPAPHASQPVAARQGTLTCLFFWLLSTEFKLWLLSLFLVGWGLWELYKQERAVWQWHPTAGVVLEAEVVSRYLRTNPPRPPLVPRLRYRYEVDGKSFESTQVTTGSPPVFATTEEGKEFLDRHRVGEAVTVLYLPDAPDQATLTVSRDGGCWILLGFGVPTLLLTAYLTWKRRRKSEPDFDVPVLA
jgi:hypothetical protein